MEYTYLGNTDLHVSRIAFGTWSFGGDWGPVQVDEGKAAIRKALELGINLFDTAQAYGFGASETMLGAALRPELSAHRHEVVLATKGGLRKAADQVSRDATPASLRRGLEESLRALGTEYVDLFQLHWPDPATPFEDTAQAMEDFVKEGKVRYVGVSNFDSSQMAAFAATRQIDAIQPPYHLFRRDIEKTILPYALRHHIGVLIYGPLAHGLLSGKYTPQTVFRADDWRSKSALFQGDVLRRNVRVVRELEQFALRREFPVAQLAIAWTLANPAVDVSIVGARTAAQIEQTAAASDIHLGTADLAEIERIMADAVPVGGPAPETV